MADIRDYLEWRGDLDFAASPMNEVDLAIISALVYLPFENIASHNLTGLTIAELDVRFNADLKLVEVLDMQRSLNGFLALLAATRRFGGGRLRRFSSITEDNEVDEKDEQFCAATFSFPAGDEEIVVVAFRGTDSTMVGWRENFTMGYADTVPAQRDALEYLTDALETFPRVYVCGHSKGGNLAMWAAAKVAAEAQERIITVLNLDGPGLNDAMLATPGWAAIRPRVRSLVPQSSVIGMLLGTGEPREVVAAEGASFAQHDLFMWHARRTAFERTDSMTASSAIVDRGIDEYMASTTDEQRRDFVYGLFKLVNPGNAATTDELLPSLMKNLPARLRASARGKDEEGLTDGERAALKEFMGCLRRAGAAELGESLAEFAEEKISALFGRGDADKDAKDAKDAAAETAEAGAGAEAEAATPDAGVDVTVPAAAEEPETTHES